MFKKLLLAITTMIFLTGFSQCSSTKTLQDTAPFTLGEVSYQKWVAGIQGGGSGINIFIPVTNKPANVVLDSVYYKDQVAKLETKPGQPAMYIARFSMPDNQNDLVISSDPKSEYGNTVAVKVVPPFPILEGEILISYLQDNKRRYYKVDELVEKQPFQYPSAPPKQP